jgi:hypothetical protein
MSTPTVETVKLKFARDYRGRPTRNDYYLAGQVGAFDPDSAEALVAEGAAIAASPDAPVSEPAEAGPERQAWQAAQRLQRQKAARPQPMAPQPEPEGPIDSFIANLNAQRAEAQRVRELDAAHQARVVALVERLPALLDKLEAWLEAQAAKDQP